MPEVIQQGKHLFFTVEIMVVPVVDPKLELLKLVLALSAKSLLNFSWRPPARTREKMANF